MMISWWLLFHAAVQNLSGTDGPHYYDKQGPHVSDHDINSQHMLALTQRL